MNTSITQNVLVRSSLMGSYQSGQMELTVNQLSVDFGGSNPSLPTPKHMSWVVVRSGQLELTLNSSGES